MHAPSDGAGRVITDVPRIYLIDDDASYNAVTLDDEVLEALDVAADGADGGREGTEGPWPVGQADLEQRRERGSGLTSHEARKGTDDTPGHPRSCGTQVQPTIGAARSSR